MAEPTPQTEPAVMHPSTRFADWPRVALAGRARVLVDLARDAMRFDDYYSAPAIFEEMAQLSDALAKYGASRALQGVYAAMDDMCSFLCMQEFTRFRRRLRFIEATDGPLIWGNA